MFRPRVDRFQTLSPSQPLEPTECRLGSRPQEWPLLRVWVTIWGDLDGSEVTHELLSVRRPKAGGCSGTAGLPDKSQQMIRGHPIAIDRL